MFNFGLCYIFQDFEKRSPLHSAAYCGEAEIADLLIMNGARVNTKDNKWLTPLHRACCSKSEVRLHLKECCVDDSNLSLRLK